MSERHTFHPIGLKGCEIYLDGMVNKAASREMRLVRIRAIFLPENLDTLRPHAWEWIGWEGLWRYCWLMDGEDAYPGQVAWMPDEDSGQSPPSDWLGWTPSEDLILVPEGVRPTP